MSTSRDAHDVDLADLNDAHTLAILSVAPGSRVLDVGPADGSVARRLVERGCRVWAVGVDARGTHECEAVCEQVVVADLEQSDVESAFAGLDFDAVLVLDVLGHLRDPLPVLRQCAAMVGHEGRLVLSVSNIAHAAVRLALLGGRFRYTEGGLLDATQLHFFDRAEVERLLDEAGLALVESLRTTAGLTETEVPIDPGSFSHEVVAEATRDADSETYRFVCVATPRDAAATASASLAPELQRRVEELEHTIRELEANGRDLRFLRDDLRLKETYIIGLRTKLVEGAERERELERALCASQHSLELLQRSSSWRITAPLRSLRAHLGNRGNRGPGMRH